ncbi:GNAT family protein [Bradyrhizobium sp. sBnM-33]|nr:GNAT family protein [Bradyrhizobium sp. sBnM-33]WOH50752.1 GNAT family protein [Bradyrhizobium sp. sBnM-33]
MEAARASIDWVFATFEIGEIIHCIDFSNAPSQAVARRLGARRDGEVDLSGKTNERWVTSRDRWRG